MQFVYSRHQLDPKERRIERFFETLPGALSWSIIVGMTVLSVTNHLLASAIMVAFVLFWVFRLLYMNIFLVISYMRLHIEKGTDWMGLIGKIGLPPESLAGVDPFRRRQIESLWRADQHPPKPEDLYHLVILPVVREGRNILEPGVKSLVDGAYPSQRVLVVIALEARAAAPVKQDVYAIQKHYAASFLDFLVVEHPGDIPGEAMVKGANATWAAKHAAKYLQDKGIAEERVIVSCFDADTVAHKEYLGCLTYYFMITPSRLRVSYQPIPVYYNNLWDVPSFARILDIGASFFQLVEATNTEKLVTFSSHSMSFKALVEVGYWPVDMISDDSAIFWKSFIHYDGDYKVVPIYTTVSMDIASGRSFGNTFVNIYKQKRRWAWGVENLPVVLRAFLRSKKISVYKKLMFASRLFDLFVSWATWSYLLTVITWLPMLFAGREFSSTTMYYMAPRIKDVIFGLSLIGLVICIAISFALLSTSTIRQRRSHMVLHVFDWLAIPFVVLLLSSVPALDAQTRLMLGKDIQFRVTEKHRNKA